MSRRRGQGGFTLLEVAIAGAILLMGLMLVAQVTRTVVDTTAPDSVQNGVVVEEFMRSQIAQIKASRDGSVTLLPDQPYGNGVLRAVVTGPTEFAAGSTHHLAEVDVVVRFVRGASSEVVAHTKFWKTWRDSGAKVGI